MRATLRMAFLAICLSICTTSQSDDSIDYIRPRASRELDLNGPLLSPKGGPHDPEQVHLALAGPAGIAVSWVTRPQVNHFAVPKNSIRIAVNRSTGTALDIGCMNESRYITLQLGLADETSGV